MLISEIYSAKIASDAFADGPGAGVGSSGGGAGAGGSSAAGPGGVRGGGGSGLGSLQRPDLEAVVADYFLSRSVCFN